MSQTNELFLEPTVGMSENIDFTESHRTLLYFTKHITKNTLNELYNISDSLRGSYLLFIEYSILSISSNTCTF